MWTTWWATAAAQEPTLPPADAPPEPAPVAVTSSTASDDVPATDFAAAADAALLDALLRLAQPASARDAALLLGTLDDVRVVEPLLAAAKVRDTGVAVAAVSALGRWPEANEALAAWIVDDDVRMAVRSAAVDALAASGRAEASAALVASLEQNLGRDLRVQVLTALATHFPDAGLEPPRSRQAAPWLAASWGWGIGYGLGAVGRAGEGLAGLGAVTGATGGATAGFLFGAIRPQRAEDAAFVATTGIVGTVSGVLVGTGIDPHDADLSWGAGAVGEAVGYGAGLALRRLHSGTAGDSAEALLPALAGAALAGAISDDADDLDLVAEGRGSPPILAAGVGLAVGYALGSALGPVWSVEPNDAPIIALGGAFGFTTGLIVADQPLADPSVAVGVSGAFLAAGYAVSPFMDFREDVLIGAAGGWGLGALVGVGVEGTVVGFDEPPQIGPAVGGAVGIGLGGTLAWLNPEGVRGNDVALAAMVGAFGTWQAVGWAVELETRDQQTGPLVAAPALATAACAALSPYLDVGVDASITGTSIGLWGGYVGASIDVFGWGGENALRGALVGSDVGVVVGAVSLAAGARPVDLMLGDVGGLVGGSSAALLSALAEPDANVVLASSLGGSAIGFAGGVVVGRVFGAPLGREDLRVGGQVAASPVYLAGRHGPVPGGQIVWSGW